MFFEIKETNVETPLAGVFSRNAGIRAAHAPPRFFIDAYSPVAYSPAAFFRRRLFPRRLFHSPPSLKNLPLKGSPRTPPAPGSRSARSIGMSY